MENGAGGLFAPVLSQSAQRALSYTAGKDHNSRMVLTTHGEGTGGKC